MPAASNERIFEVDIRPRSPVSITLARWKVRDQIAHARQRLQESRFRFFADIRCGISATAALRVFLGRLFELLADADEIDHQSSRLVPENPVHSGDRLHK